MSTATDKLFEKLYRQTEAGKLRWERAVDDGFIASTANYSFIVRSGRLTITNSYGSDGGVVRVGDADMGKLLRLITEHTHYAPDSDVEEALKELGE